MTIRNPARTSCWSSTSATRTGPSGASGGVVIGLLVCRSGRCGGPGRCGRRPARTRVGGYGVRSRSGDASGARRACGRPQGRAAARAPAGSAATNRTRNPPPGRGPAVTRAAEHRRRARACRAASREPAPLVGAGGADGGEAAAVVAHPQLHRVLAATARRTVTAGSRAGVLEHVGRAPPGRSGDASARRRAAACRSAAHADEDTRSPLARTCSTRCRCRGVGLGLQGAGPRRRRLPAHVPAALAAPRARRPGPGPGREPGRRGRARRGPAAWAARRSSRSTPSSRRMSASAARPVSAMVPSERGGGGGVGVRGVPPAVGLRDDHGQGVGDDVVHLPGDPGPLGGRRDLRLLVALDLEPLGAVAQGHDASPAATGAPARTPTRPGRHDGQPVPRRRVDVGAGAVEPAFSDDAEHDRPDQRADDRHRGAPSAGRRR